MSGKYLYRDTPTHILWAEINSATTSERTRSTRMMAFVKRIQTRNVPTTIFDHIEVPKMPDRVRAIVDEVARKHRIPVRLMFFRTANATVAHARQDAMAEVKRRIPVATNPLIGKWFGGFDHSTVHHAIKANERRSQVSA
jgi:chromosomal replication initiation ATPase DnaA